METVGEFLRAERDKKGLTIKELGKLTGVSISFISQIETGKRVPSDLVCEKLAAVLNIDPGELIRRKGKIYVVEKEIIKEVIVEKEPLTPDSSINKFARTLYEADLKPHELDYVMQQAVATIRYFVFNRRHTKE